MRVLIYGQGLEADAILQAEREAGRHASLRTPEPGLFDTKKPEPCDAVHCWDSFIADAYHGKAEVHDHTQTEVKPKRKRK